MKKQISLALAGAMLVMALAGCSSGGSSSSSGSSDSGSSGSPALSIIVASNQTSMDNPYSYGMDKFKEVLEDISGGTIDVTVHKGTLGEDEAALVEKLEMGGANIIVCSPALMTGVGVPELDMFSLEFLFDSYDHWEKCLDGEFGEAMKELVAEKSDNRFIILDYWSSSIRDVYAKKAVTSPADLKGLNIRGQSSNVQVQFWIDCGAIPQNVAFGELYQALQQGVVDGAENDYTNLMQKEHHKTDNGKYISETDHDITTRLWITTGSWFNGLTEEQRNWIQEASDQATIEEREVTMRMRDESKEKCIEDGAIITEHDDIDIDAFKAIADPIMDDFAEQYGLEEYLQMVRDAA